MKKLLTILLLMSGLLFLSNCDKEEDKDDDNAKTELITASKWYPIAHTVNPGIDIDLDGDVETDLYAHTPCAYDGYWQFASSGTITMNQGADLCNGQEEQEMTGSWGFLNGGTQLVIPPGTMDIVELNSSTLKYTYSSTTQNTTYIQTFTFSH